MNDCIFSPCRTFRYRLDHVFDASLPRVAFVMLNPSTADEQQLDPTLRRCVGFARSWGFGGITVGNLFAFRATDPREMKRALDPVGPENDAVLDQIAIQSELVICAWGQHGKFQGRAERVSWALRKHRALCAIELSADGTSKHPLYLRGDLRPILFAAERTVAA